MPGEGRVDLGPNTRIREVFVLLEDENLKQFLKTTILLSAQLDDAGLSIAAFRVYSHLSRRAGRGIAFPSCESMAKICRMNRDTVWRALKELGERNMIRRISRPGVTTEYTLTNPSEWAANPAENEGHPSNWVSGKEGVGGSGKEGVGGSGKEGALRRPTEGDPSKETPIAPKKKKADWRPIYEAYPKHVAPAAAQKAIEKALATTSAETLLEAAQAFSDAVAGTEKQFIPHPATWFNARRWEDDRSTWIRESAPIETNGNGEELATGRTTAERGETLAHWKSRILAFHKINPEIVMGRITNEEKRMLGLA